MAAPLRAEQGRGRRHLQGRRRRRQKSSAYWEAVYKFSKTGRTVHNKIHASFEFKDGKIYRHRDDFSMWRWSSMALGPIGFLLGFTPIVAGKIRKQSRALLDDFMKKQS